MEDIGSDPIEMLEAQYRYLGEFLGELGLAESGEDRAAWLLDFTLETDLAARIEQQIHLTISAADTRLIIEEAAAERAVMARVLCHLRILGDPLAESFDFLLGTLQGLFRSHVARQRRELYELVRERLSGAAKRDCAEWIRIAQLGPDAAGGGRPAPSPARRPAWS